MRGSVTEVEHEMTECYLTVEVERNNVLGSVERVGTFPLYGGGTKAILRFGGSVVERPPCA